MCIGNAILNPSGYYLFANFKRMLEGRNFDAMMRSLRRLMLGFRLLSNHSCWTDCFILEGNYAGEPKTIFCKRKTRCLLHSGNWLLMYYVCLHIDIYFETYCICVTTVQQRKFNKFHLCISIRTESFTKKESDTYIRYILVHRHWFRLDLKNE